MIKIWFGFVFKKYLLIYIVNGDNRRNLIYIGNILIVYIWEMKWNIKFILFKEW